MVQGDQVRLKLSCGPDATMFVGSQANGRVFKHEQLADAEQIVVGTVESSGCAVVFPEPVVLHAASRFVQRQEWSVAKGASLVLGDWFQSGRSDSGEQFAYQAWTSETRLTIDGRLACVDRFRSDPDKDDPDSPARFGGRNLMLNVYVAGPVCEYLAGTLDALAAIEEVPQLLELDQKADAVYPGVVSSLTAVEGQDLSILRCLADTREDLNFVFEALYTALADAAWLGFNPANRKP